jgi:UDP-N-acetylglucosamine--N-acetylmuramyl-(pentapeptide) pyrophosphoryl-undecaprenol N-acetylglucosamine transferase
MIRLQADSSQLIALSNKKIESFRLLAIRYQLSALGQSNTRPKKTVSGSNDQRSKALRIVIAGGGTGGHLFPGVAIAQEFRARNPLNEIIFVSTGNPLEKRILSNMNFALECIRVEGIKGRGLWNQIKSVSKLPAGILGSFKILRRFKPDLIVGLGSYSAGPAVLAARLMGKKIVLHEQNLLPGITNRMLAQFADVIFVSFEDTKAHISSRKTLFSGNPVRRDILEGSMQQEAGSGVGGAQKPFTVSIIGGSQGAHQINVTVAEALNHLQQRDDLYFIHQTGAADEAMLSESYRSQNLNATVQAFFDDMAQLYSSSDLIICRAGATTVAELTALGKAAIFVPFPHAADNHQVLNAQALVKNGAAEMILEQDLTAEILGEKINDYASRPRALAEMARRSKSQGNPNAAGDIVDHCYALVRGRG